MPISKLLPDGRVEIYNNNTGEIKQVAPEELRNFNPHLVGQYLQMKNQSVDPMAQYSASPQAPTTPAPATAPASNYVTPPTLPATGNTPPAASSTPTPPPQPPQDSGNILSSIGNALIDPVAKFSRLATGGLMQAPGMAMGMGNLKDSPMVKNTPLNNFVGLSEKELKQMDGKSTGERVANTSKEATRRAAGAMGTAIMAMMPSAGLLPTIGMGAGAGALQGADVGDEFSVGNTIAGGAGGAAGAGAGYGLNKVAQGVGGMAANQAGRLNASGAPQGAMNAMLKTAAPYALGAGAGGGLGLFKGKNLASTATGIGGGLALAGALQSPAAMGAVANAAPMVGKYLPQILGQAGAAAGAGTNQFLNNGESMPPIDSASASGTNPPPTNTMPPIGQPNVAPQNNSLTGHTPQELYSAYMKASQAGDVDAAKELRQRFEDETKNQGKAEVVNPKAQNALTALGQVKTMAINPNGQINRQTLLSEKMSPGNSQYESSTYQLADQLLRSQTSRAPTPDQVTQYRDELFPNALLDDDKTFKSKLANIEGMLNNLYLAKPTTDFADLMAPQ